MTSNNDDDVVVSELMLQSPPLAILRVAISLRKDLTNYLKLKYQNNESAIDVNEQKEIEYIFSLGLMSARNILYSKSSSLLHKGKKPRNDVWLNLARIVIEFQIYTSYPKIQSIDLAKILNKALGNRDFRVVKDYRRTVLLYCSQDERIIDRCSDSRFGELDVSFFVSLIPKQHIEFLQASSSTSSSEECGD